MQEKKKYKNEGRFVEKAGIYAPLHPENSFSRAEVVIKSLSYGAADDYKSTCDIISKVGESLIKKGRNLKLA